MRKSEILPEICYNYKALSLEEIFNAFVDKQTVTGRVEKLLPEQQIVVVRLGDEIVSHMPYCEATIYPLRYPKNLTSSIPANIYSLVGKNIRVRITGIGGHFIKVSRKASMISALENIYKSELATFHIKSVEHKCAFGDVGAGIIGRMIIDEVCRTHIKSIKEYFKPNAIIPIKILEITEDKCANVSYKQTFQPYNKQEYTVGMVVRGKVCDYIRNSKNPGFYINISPQVSGIMDVKSGQKQFKYGAMVECLIRDASEHGLHLDFSKFIEV